MGQSRARGFTLVELLVVIAIIGTLVGLLLPAIQSSREASRTLQCSVQLTELTKAMQMYEKDNGGYPGYIEPVGLESLGQFKGSWVVVLLPHIEQNALWETWSMPGKNPKASQVATFICPSSSSTSEDAPGLSYVANAGWIKREPLDICEHITEKIANGVFFDRTRGIGTQDQREVSDGCQDELRDPVIKMTFAYIQTGDGTTNTMLFSERVRQVPWADPTGGAVDRKWNHGFCWAQRYDVLDGFAAPDKRQAMRINAHEGDSDYTELEDLTDLDGFPSSRHPGGVNVAFVGGAVRFVKDNIDFLVYAQLMTSNRRSSDLNKRNSSDDFIPDKDLDQPDDSDY